MTTVQVRSSRADEYTALLTGAGVRVGPDGAVMLADPTEMNGLDGVRWVQSTWAGVDAVDWSVVPAGTVITSLPGVFGPQMAEFVFAYLLAHVQHVPWRYSNRTWDERLPETLAGSTLGILGAGSIGGAIAETAAGFGMRVVGCRRSGAADPRYERMYPMSEIDDFATGLDHLVAVLPATAETRGLVDRELLGRLRPGAVFVNVGRGATAVTDDVVEAVVDGRLALAVLDVTDPEPLPGGHPAWSVPGVVVTGHTAAHSRPDDIVGFFLENLARYEAGEALHGVVDPGRGY